MGHFTAFLVGDAVLRALLDKSGVISRGRRRRRRCLNAWHSFLSFSLSASLLAIGSVLDGCKVNPQMQQQPL